MARYIFITGGVVSSLGKGLASAALGALLQARGYGVRLRKLDPYLNVDPGTMSPYQHGEVFVTDDGAETDLDLGHYERFTGNAASKRDNITTGRIYQDIERVREFLEVEEMIKFRCRTGVPKPKPPAPPPAPVSAEGVPVPDRNPNREATAAVDAKPSQTVADSDKTPPSKAKATQ